MSQPEFMSAEHVAAMNLRLRDDQAVRAACRRIDDGPHVMLYRLRDGSAGEDVLWAVHVDETVRFELADHLHPDVVLTGDWWRMIEAVRAGREGRAVEADLRVEGDLRVVASLMAVLDVARPVATMPTSLPER
jgi:hypothetical protein